MNSVKYNNWKDAVRAHHPGGFDANAAWEKFRQRNQPERKRKKWLPWLAAACVCGILLSVFIMNSHDKKPVVKKSDITVPAKNNIAVQQPASTQTNVQPEKNEVHDIKQQTFITTANPVQKEKAKLPTEENAVFPVPETPVNIVPVIPGNNGTPVTAKVEPVKEEPKRAALKVVHINELNNTRTDYAQQDIPQPEKRITPKMPLAKPSYANYDPEENEPPKVKRSGGLLRSMASLKEN